MKEGPDISIVAALIGNPACANMLTALLTGPALTATELAQEAGLSLSTVSGHLDELEKAGLVAVERQGRHRYFRLADPDVGACRRALLTGARARVGYARPRRLLHIRRRRIEPRQPVVVLLRGAALEQRVAHLPFQTLGVIDAIHHQRRYLHPRGAHDAGILIALKRLSEIAVPFSDDRA